MTTSPTTTTVHVRPSTPISVRLARDSRTVFVHAGGVTLFGAPADVEGLLEHALDELRRVAAS